MYCSNCGNKIDEEVKFCPFCGASQVMSNDGSSTMNELKTNIDNGKQSGNLYRVIGWVSVAFSLFFLPPLLGAVSVIMGYLYRDHEEKQGTIIMIAGVAAAIFGMLLGSATYY